MSIAVCVIFTSGWRHYLFNVFYGNWNRKLKFMFDTISKFYMKFWFRAITQYYNRTIANKGLAILGSQNNFVFFFQWNIEMFYALMLMQSTIISWGKKNNQNLLRINKNCSHGKWFMSAIGNSNATSCNDDIKY